MEEKRMKKKALSLLLAGTMVLSLAACGGNTPATSAAPEAEPAAEEPAAEEPAATEEEAPAEEEAAGGELTDGKFADTRKITV